MLPHLHDRPLTLKRYPNGVDEPYFYEKQSPSHRPEWVQTARVGDVNYTLCQDRATLVWLANLADIELHTSLSLGPGPRRRRCSCSTWTPARPPGSSSAARWRSCCAACSGRSAWRAWSRPRAPRGCSSTCRSTTEVTYEQTKPFARRVAELLEQRLPELVVSRMTKRLREGKVLVDWSQNDDHKTTVTVYSVRARERPTVSAPVSWEEVQACQDARDPELLELRHRRRCSTRVAADGDLFAMLLLTRQQLPRI